ncbi:diguanylate cyclase domain-containing protein [Vallitalea okinawensis]|uniref:diguanylate cyclase domain-containing protein n=1 Tax=Vallitalea okinawensis TaxID=2078660 RepID=UPI000CFD9AD5|nr:diguanylate cyclase [Vallitalea okinawensis]
MTKSVANQQYITEMEKYSFVDPKKCYSFAKSVYEKYSDTEDKRICAYGLYYMAKSKRHLNEWEVAEVYILKALRLVEEVELRIHMYLEYTAILKDSSNYQLAYEYLYAAYDESFKIGSEKEIFLKIFNSFGVMYAEVGETKKALKSFLQCTEYVTETDVIHYTIIHLNICESYIKLGELELAKFYAEKSKQALSDKNISVVWSYYYNLVTQIYIKLEDYQQALIHINEGIKLTINDKTNDYIQFMNYKAEILKHLCKKKCAIEYYRYALKTAEEKGFDPAIETALKGLIEIYESFQNSEELIKYLKLFYDYQNTKEKQRQVTLRNSMKSVDEKFESHKKVMRLQRQNEMLHRMNKSVKHIHDLCKNILLKSEMDSVFSELHHNILSLTQADIFGICLLNDSKTRIIVNFFNLDKRSAIKGELPFDKEQNIISKVIKEKEHLYINDLKQYKGSFKVLDSNDGSVSKTTTMRSVIYIPLYDDMEVFGVITIQSSRENAYTQEDIELMEIIASFASVAIRNLTKSKQLNRLSTRDPLTNLYNRRALQDKVHNMTSERVAMLFIDIDYFKEYNDYYGHLKGDECIQTVANVLQEVLDQEDFIARYGGDEFIIVLKDATSRSLMKSANAVKEKMDQLKIGHKNSKITNHVTLSIGAANMQLTEESSIDDILHITDKALYEAKARGRNQIAFLFG